MRRRILVDLLLIGLAVLLQRSVSLRLTILGVEGVRIGFGALPLLLAGFMFEPIDALFVGALSDIIGYSLSHIGAYVPYFTITAALKGWVPSFVHKYVFKKDFNWLHVFVSIMIGFSVNDLFLVPYFLYLSFGIPFWAGFTPRLIALPPYLIIYPYLILFLVRDWWLKWE